MRHPHPTPRRVTLALMLAAALMASGCVTTERRTTRSAPGLTYAAKPYGTPTPQGSPDSSSTATTQTPALPEGPITRPAGAQSTSTSRVRVAMMDLGMIPSDGMVLPLTSPDGRFVAVEVGAAPTWPTLLAAPGAEVPNGLRILAYTLPDPSNPGSAPAATQVNWPTDHAGFVLGRSCDNTGFLIEAPQENGSRWIGRINWVSGALTWLVQDDKVNAHATLGPGGELAFTRRTQDSTSIELVVRTPSGPSAAFAGKDVPAKDHVLASPIASYLFPMFADEPGVVYCFSTGASGIDLIAVKLLEPSSPHMPAIVGRMNVLKTVDVSVIYQAVASVQTPIPAKLEAPGQPPSPFGKVIFFHPTQRRIGVFDRKTASAVGLFPGSMAAIPVDEPAGPPTAPDAAPTEPRLGYLVTTQRGLEFVAISQQSAFDRARGTPVTTVEGAGGLVSPGQFVPRLTIRRDWPYLLIGPSSDPKDLRFHLMRVHLESAEGSGG